MTTKWKRLTGEAVPDLEAFVREACRGGQEVHVGTDSLQSGRYTHFVTVVAILTPHKGGRAIYRREVTSRITSLRERLFREVWLSVEVAMLLAPVVPGEMTVHIDANTEQRYASSRYVEELVGLVVSQGFKYHVKPEAWASTTCADHIVRTRGRLPREDRVLEVRKAG